MKEANQKVQELTTELNSSRADHDKLKVENERTSKLMGQLEKELKGSSKSGPEIESLKLQLSEALQNSDTLKTQVDDLKSQLGDIETERANHQRLIKEFGKLEQRYEKVNSNLSRYTKSSSKSGLTLSKQEPINELESLIEEIDNHEDNMKIIKSSATSSEVNEEVESFEKNKLMYMTLNGSEMDMGLLSKLQKRIQFLESERKDFIELGYVKSGGKNTENDIINNNHRELIGDKSSPQYAFIER